MRLAQLLTLAVIALSLVALAWRAWDPPTDRAAQQQVSELRYQNCLLNAMARGAANITGLEDIVSRAGRETTEVKALALKCKAP